MIVSKQMKNSLKRENSQCFRRGVKKPKGETEHALRLWWELAKGLMGKFTEVGERLCLVASLGAKPLWAFPERLDNGPLACMKSLRFQVANCILTCETRSGEGFYMICGHVEQLLF